MLLKKKKKDFEIISIPGKLQSNDSAKMGSLGISRELQFESLQPRQATCKSLHSKGRTVFYRERSRESYSKHRVHGFPSSESRPGNRRSLFFLLGSTVISGSRAPSPKLLISQLQLTDTSVYFL